MPSVWDVAGEALEGTILAPLVIGGAIVAAVASPDVRRRVRQLGVRGMAAALAATDAARREVRLTTNGTGGLAVQVGQRVREAVAEVREDWEDFVAEARAERAKQHGRNGAMAAAEASSSGAARSTGTASRRARAGARKTKR
jgi:hypothetical protein